MDVQLVTPHPAVNMLGVHIFPEETTVRFYCHDKVFQRADVLDMEGKSLFRIAGTAWGTSWSWRRKVYHGETDQHLYDFRHASLDLKNRWVVEDTTGRKICSIVHEHQLTTTHSAVNATVRTSTGEDVVINMRPCDGAGLITVVSIDNQPCAVFRKAVDNTNRFFGDQDKTVWEIRVAPKVDLSMILVMAMCRAEMSHVWKQ